MNNEYLSQLETASRLQVSYKKVASLSEKYPDKLPRTVRIKEGKKNFFFKVSDVHAFKKLLNSQNQPKQTESRVEFLTQRDRLRDGFVFKNGKWLE